MGKVELRRSPESSHDDPHSEDVAKTPATDFDSRDHPPSDCTRGDLEKITERFSHLPELELGLPTVDERPWDAREGFFCAYETWFKDCKLWFPLPDLLIAYVNARNLALSQLCPSTVQRVVAMLVSAAEIDEEIAPLFLEEVSSIVPNQRTKGTYYINFKPCCKGMWTDFPNKLFFWQKKYFFVKINSASVPGTAKLRRRDWATSPPGNFVF